jgi:hypothetical protein
MSCALTAFSVKIATSGEMAIKGIIAREVIYDWNAARSWEEKKALLPLPLQDDAAGPADLLVAFFRPAQQVTSADLEIERQLESGRPTLIYFSEARTDFADEDEDADVLQELKKRYPAEAMIDSFKDEKELRAKLARQLETLVRYHAYFRTQGEISAPSKSAPTGVSKSAQTLLIGACDDPEAYLARMKDSRGIKIQVNGHQFVEHGNPDSAAQWDGAFNELLAADMIRDAGCNGQLFQISSRGFEFLETLGKKPIGYIAELGGM